MIIVNGNINTQKVTVNGGGVIAMTISGTAGSITVDGVTPVQTIITATEERREIILAGQWPNITTGDFATIDGGLIM
jgi:hypothetical protein